MSDFEDDFFGDLPGTADEGKDEHEEENKYKGNANKQKKKAVCPGHRLFYTVIATDDVPDAIANDISNLVGALANRSFILRTFPSDNNLCQNAIKGTKSFEPYIPFNGYNDSGESEFTTTPWNKKLGAEIISGWSRIPDNIHSIVGVNIAVMLGKWNSEHSKFLIVWTPDGVENSNKTNRETGYVSTAIEVAHIYGIPVFNLKREDAMPRLKEHLSTYRYR